MRSTPKIKSTLVRTSIKRYKKDSKISRGFMTKVSLSARIFAQIRAVYAGYSGNLSFECSRHNYKNRVPKFNISFAKFSGKRHLILVNILHQYQYFTKQSNTQVQRSMAANRESTKCSSRMTSNMVLPNPIFQKNFHHQRHAVFRSSFWKS